MIAATTIAAYLVATATVDAPATWWRRLYLVATATVYRDLDLSATAIPGRGTGIREPQLMAPVPWCANVAIRNGAPFYSTDQLDRHQGWYSADCASDDEVRKSVEAAAHLGTTLQMAAYRINALDAKLTDTRRAMRTGFSARGFFAIYSRPHPLFPPKVGLVSRRALGSAAIEPREESDSPMPAAEGRGGADD